MSASANGSRCTALPSTCLVTSRPSIKLCLVGIANVRMTSIEKESGETRSVEEVAARAGELFARAVIRRPLVSARGLNRWLARTRSHCLRLISMGIPLEDNAADVIGKAQRGLGISDSQLAERAKLSAEQVRKLRDGQFDEQSIKRVAPLLGLNAEALLKLAAGKWTPEEIPELAGLAAVQYDVRRHDGERLSPLGSGDA